MSSELLIRLSSPPAPAVSQVRQATAREGPPEAPAEKAQDKAENKAENKGQPAAPQAVDKAVERLNDIVQTVRRELRFSVDEESGRSVVKVIDSETNETIRQIPAEEILELSNRLQESQSGLVIAKV